MKFRTGICGWTQIKQPIMDMDKLVRPKKFVIIDISGVMLKFILCQIEEELTAMYCLLWRILSATVGIIAIVVTLTKYPQYLNTLHENKLWFSNIKVSLTVPFSI